MFIDAVLPKNNEKEFIDMAKKLKIDSLIFIYPFINQNDIEEKRKKLIDFKDIKVEIGVLVDEKLVMKLQNTNDYIFSKTPSLSLIENKKSYIFYDFELQDKPDFLHHRNSGLNQVIANEMKDKGKIFAFSFSTYLNSTNKGLILGRMKQNAKITKKYKINTEVLSFAKKPYEMRSKHEIDAFKKMIGL